MDSSLAEIVDEVLSIFSRKKVIGIAVILLAMIHIIPISSGFTPMAESTYDTSQSKWPCLFIFMQILLALLFIVCVVNRESDLIFPFVCLLFGIYIFFIPYNFIELVPKYRKLRSKKGSSSTRIANPIILVLISGMIILLGVLLYYFHEKLLEEKCGTVSSNVANKKTAENENAESKVKIGKTSNTNSTE